jgi:hypothetical protein
VAAGGIMSGLYSSSTGEYSEALKRLSSAITLKNTFFVKVFKLIERANWFTDKTSFVTCTNSSFKLLALKTRYHAKSSSEFCDLFIVTISFPSIVPASPEGIAVGVESSSCYEDGNEVVAYPSLIIALQHNNLQSQASCLRKYLLLVEACLL